MLEVKTPTLGESVSEATIAKWYKQEGEAIAKDELLAELETDKVTLEVNADQGGVISALKFAEGDSVTEGDLLALIDESATAAKNDNASAPKAEEAAPAAAAPASTGGGNSPAANKIMAEKGINSADVAGTGKGGRITKADAQNFTPAAAGGAVAPAAIDQGQLEERVKMSKLRQTIARRLKDSQNTAAILTTFNEVDMSAVMNLRKKYQDGFVKKNDVKLGFMSFFTKAAVAALKELPAVNAEIDGEEIVYKNYFNIGMAVGTPSGLVVPVVKDADKLSMADIEKTIVDFGRRARDGKISMAEMQGGSFTITNGGVFGSMLSTPIINPPQSGILGLHNITERAVVVDGEIVIRPMMYIALSYDHRIIDGREAVTFLVRIKEFIEDPAKLIIG